MARNKGGQAARNQGSEVPGTAQNQGAKVPDGRSGKRVKSQLHLDATTDKALGLHAVMSGKSKSKVADDILWRWLKKSGQGRSLILPGSREPDVLSTSDTSEDRQSEPAA